MLQQEAMRQLDALPAEKLREMYRKMVMIRRFDTRIHDLYNEGLIRGSTHPYLGMEAVAVGAIAALKPDDYISSTHRGHGHCIAKGCDVNLMMAEIIGRATGYCKGKGGSMHIADMDLGMLGANGIVGGGNGLATGAALTAKLKRTGQVAVCFFGDGALNQGSLYECANMAVIWKLPVIYLCENNQYAMSASVKQMTGVRDLTDRATGFGMPGVGVDGMDVGAVYGAVAEAAERARMGDGPSMVVATTYRFGGHHTIDSQVYRTKEEVREWQEKDAIPRFRKYLIARGVLTENSAEALEAEVEAELRDAEAFARSSPEPDASWLYTDVYAE